ncbi:MAG TPA: alkaline phosphatase family protein [Gemmataceae bacterium]|nr:alkaline phosphatase family protein [Gemmataceae bacterium]
MFYRTWRQWSRFIMESVRRNAAGSRKQARASSFRPRLEVLEERACPSTLGDVFVIELENHNWTQTASENSDQLALLGNAAAPYINSLVTPGMIDPVTGQTNPAEQQTSYASDYYNVDYSNPSVSIHPSLPNYIWQEAGIPATPGTPTQDLTDGDPYAINPATGNNFIVNAPSLSALLQNAYGTAGWRSYQEDMQFTGLSVPTVTAGGTIPNGGTNPFNGSTQYAFAPRHDGALYFTATNGGTLNGPGPADSSNTEAAYYAPLQQLQTDLNNNTVAMYSLITPDLYNDMHGPADFNFTYNGVAYLGSPTNPGSDQESVALGDNFLSKIIPEIMASQAYQNNGAIIIRMDETEGGNSTAFTLPEIVISPLAKGNAYDSTITYTHSSDLKSLQELFGVTGGGLLGDANTPNTSDLSDMFKAGALNTPVVTNPVAAEFPGLGVWRNVNDAWQQLTPSNFNASQVAVDSGGDVVAEFPGVGVWLYNNSTSAWGQLTPGSFNASQVSIAGGDVVAEFPGVGVWRYEAGSWQQLTPGSFNASSVDIDSSGDVAAEFPGVGVWRYETAGGWAQLTPGGFNATQVSIAGNGLVAAAFNGVGVWLYNAGWQQLSNTTATISKIDVDANGDVAVDFPGYGVWRYESATGWNQLSPADASLGLNALDASLLAIDASGNVVVDIPGQGVRRWDGTAGWEQLTTLGASALDA